MWEAACRWQQSILIRQTVVRRATARDWSAAAARGRVCRQTDRRWVWYLTMKLDCVSNHITADQSNDHVQNKQTRQKNKNEQMKNVARIGNNWEQLTATIMQRSYVLLHLCVCKVTQCIRNSVLDSGWGTVFAGERTLAGIQVFLQLVFHLQIRLRR